MKRLGTAMTMSPKPYVNRPRVKPDGSVGEGYRYPAPGSAIPKEHHVPRETTERIWDIGYFKRDVARSRQDHHVLVGGEEVAALEGGKKAEELQFLPLHEEERALGGSPGGKNADVERYDPSGLRSAMTASHAATEASLDTFMPTHLPDAVWEVDADELIASCAAKDIPLPPGRPWRIRARDRSVLEHPKW
eukprot:PLAT8284.1.p2 GENE.PLAT8284.1~~PLAT8284.1.p2  ORF type:complete len:210 (+),score=82.00 PLAT8284.1:60-632(+)